MDVDAAANLISFSHPVTWEATPNTVFVQGERRLDAGVYLSDGYGRRLAIEGRGQGWSRLSKLADVWQPSRLKGVLVAPELGVGYLSAGQVFEARPTPRRWMAVAKIGPPAERFVTRGILLVSRSGNVGRVTVTHSAHLDRVISDDLLRVVPKSPAYRGWLYAYMRTPFFRSMATTSNYGHVIKHIEVGHLDQLPVIEPRIDFVHEIETKVSEIFAVRDRARELTQLAEERYQEAWGGFTPTASSDGFVVSITEVVSTRRRLEGVYHNPIVAALESKMHQVARTVASLRDVCHDVFAPARFTRAFGPEGMPYRSAEELFDLNAPITKRIYSGLVEGSERYILHRGWLVMACSGQIYGLNGSVKLLGERENDVFGTHDLIRIIPNETLIRSGYLITALSHPILGRPLVVRHAYGTSIPHLDVIDVERVAFPRFDELVESDIAEAAEQAARLQGAADNLEDDVVALAQSEIERYLQTAGS